MNEEPDILSEETIEATAKLLLVLRGVHLRLVAEGYVFGEYELRNKEGELLYTRVKDGKWISIK